jgi:hypothetical protein
MITVPLGVVEAVASVVVGSDGGGGGVGAGGGVGGAMSVSLEAGTVLTVSVVSANATLRSCALKSHEVLVASGAVVVGVVVVGAVGTVPVAVLVAVPSSAAVAVAVVNPGIFHTSVKPTPFMSPSVL